LLSFNQATGQLSGQQRQHQAINPKPNSVLVLSLLKSIAIDASQAALSHLPVSAGLHAIQLVGE
jgi:hypothetical protein